MELLWGGVTVRATTDALQIANVLSVKVNNTLDVYYQSTQNLDGGFGNTPISTRPLQLYVDSAIFLLIAHNSTIERYLDTTIPA